MSPKGPMDVRDFLEKLALYVRVRPELASRAYTAAAQKMRKEADKSPENRFALQAIANKLDVLSAEATTPEVEFEPQDIVSIFADGLEDGIVTEYDALVSNVAASKVDEEGNARTELASAIMQQHYMDEQERQIAEPVQIIPASVKTGITLLGSQALVQYGGISSSGSFTAATGIAGVVAAQNECCVVRWEGRDVETMACTVAVFIGAGSGATYPTASSGSSRYSYRPYARVQFGAGGHGQPNEVILDVGRGCQFTVCANFLYVNIGMDAPNASQAATYIPGAMVLGASMGFFTSARQSNVYRTLYADAVAGSSGTKTIILPKFATTIQNLVTGTPANWTVAIQDTFGTTIATYTPPASGILNAPLSNDAYQILFTNTGMSADNAELVLGLSL